MLFVKSTSGKGKRENVRYPEEAIRFSMRFCAEVLIIKGLDLFTRLSMLERMSKNEKTISFLIYTTKFNIKFSGPVYFGIQLRKHVRYLFVLRLAQAVCNLVLYFLTVFTKTIQGQF